jgi:hypothetical protein
MPARQKFLVSELWILSWGASVQRASLFKPGTSEFDRRRFRDRVIVFATDRILGAYASAVSEATHERNISLLSAYGTDEGKTILGPQGYKIGVAQKLLNLQLKYLWCLGLIAEPPHCPIDRVVIAKSALRDEVAWTQITEIETYRRVIRALKPLADQMGQSLACWELHSYDRADALTRRSDVR